MAQFFLRVEGINLKHVLYDTQDLSTIRGASLTLLHVIDKLTERLHTAYGAEAATTGASIGLWRFDAADETAAENIARTVRRWLRNGVILGAEEHCTFAVDIAADAGTPDSYLHARETLIAASRWRQMQERSVVYPKEEKHTSLDTRVCELDLNRPAKPGKEGIKGEEKAVSLSVWDRRGYGLKAKQLFYRQELRKGVKDRNGIAIALNAPANLPKDDDRPFPMHFASITEPNFPNIRTQLKSKIAVFYADGNGFSKIQNRIIGDDSATAFGATPFDRQRKLDETMKAYRRDFLWRLLHLLAENKAIGTVDEGESKERKLRYGSGAAKTVLRMETLLWGGDEFLFVLPARLGLQAVRLFFDTIAGKQNGLTTGDGKRPLNFGLWQLGRRDLTFAAGLVFCHENAPITHIRRLANDLADFAKDHDRTRNILLPMVLESFDHIGGSLDYFWDKRRPKGLDEAHLLMPAEALDLLQDAAEELRDIQFPRRRLKALARTLHADGVYGKIHKRVINDIEQDIGPLFSLPAMQSAADTLCVSSTDAAQRQAALTYYLEELWDYLLPVKSPTP